MTLSPLRSAAPARRDQGAESGGGSVAERRPRTARLARAAARGRVVGMGRTLDLPRAARPRTAGGAAVGLVLLL